MITNKTFLIIDDFATMRKILTNFLKKLGYTNITEAENAELGWDLIQKQDFDLVISDYNMPEMNGLELLTKIRQDARLQNQKFIMLTAETDRDILISTRKLHIDGYILKPFTIEVIEEKINSIFNS